MFCILSQTGSKIPMVRPSTKALNTGVRKLFLLRPKSPYTWEIGNGNGNGWEADGYDDGWLTAGHSTWLICVTFDVFKVTLKGAKFFRRISVLWSYRWANSDQIRHTTCNAYGKGCVSTFQSRVAGLSAPEFSGDAAYALTVWRSTTKFGKMTRMGDWRVSMWSATPQILEGGPQCTHILGLNST